MIFYPDKNIALMIPDFNMTYKIVVCDALIKGNLHQLTTKTVEEIIRFDNAVLSITQLS
jgi:hypothetical protein